MKKKFKIIKKCQISGEGNLKKILSLGFLPPVNKLNKIGEKPNEKDLFPADLMYSEKSKLVQINTIVNKKILFPKSYPYTSSTTKILRDNFKELYQ